jgi:hypothetical protein
MYVLYETVAAGARRGGSRMMDLKPPLLRHKSAKVLERDCGILFELLGVPLGVRGCGETQSESQLYCCCMRGDHVVGLVACVSSRSKKTKK